MIVPPTFPAEFFIWNDILELNLIGWGDRNAVTPVLTVTAESTTPRITSILLVDLELYPVSHTVTPSIVRTPWTRSGTGKV